MSAPDADPARSPCRITQLRDEIASCRGARGGSPRRARTRDRPRRSTIQVMDSTPASDSFPASPSPTLSNSLRVEPMMMQSSNPPSPSPSPSPTIVGNSAPTVVQPTERRTRENDPGTPGGSPDASAGIGSPISVAEGAPASTPVPQSTLTCSSPSGVASSPPSPRTQRDVCEGALADAILEDVFATFLQSGSALAEQLAQRIQEVGKTFCEESRQLVGDLRMRAEAHLENTRSAGLSMHLVDGAFDFEDTFPCKVRTEKGKPRWERRKRSPPRRSSQKNVSKNSTSHSSLPVKCCSQKNSVSKLAELDCSSAPSVDELLLCDTSNGNAQKVTLSVDNACVSIQANPNVAGATREPADEVDVNYNFASTQDRKDTESKYKNAIGDMRTLMPDVDELVRKTAEANASKGIEEFYKTTGWAQAVARSNIFENASMFVIAINAIWIFIDADYNDADSPIEAAIQFQVVENLFCVFFTWELLVKILALQKKTMMFKSIWLMFDTFLVSTMLVETWFVPIYLRIAASSGSSASGPNTQFLKTFKLLRLTRAARIVRLLRIVPEFLVLMRALVAGVRAVFFTIVLMVAFSYIFAIILKQITEDTPGIKNLYFATIPMGMKNLLIQAAFPDIGDLLDELAAANPVAVIVFFTSVLITALAMLNMLIGVLCEVVTLVAAVEKEGKTVEFLTSNMRDFLLEADLDGDGLINKQEFLTLFKKDDMIKFLLYIDIDIRSLIQYVDVLYANDDHFDYDEVVKIVRRVKGSNACTVQDINDMRTWISKELSAFKQEMTVACKK